MDRATKYEAKTAKKASDANIKHEKAVISLKDLTEKSTVRLLFLLLREEQESQD